MSDPKPPVVLTDPTKKALLGFVDRDFKRFVKRARTLRNDLGKMEADISEAVLVHERMLDELTRKLLTVSAELAGQDVELALKAAVTGMKAHAEWREIVAPIARRLGERLRQQKALAAQTEKELICEARAVNQPSASVQETVGESAPRNGRSAARKSKKVQSKQGGSDQSSEADVQAKEPQGQTCRRTGLLAENTTDSTRTAPKGADGS